MNRIETVDKSCHLFQYIVKAMLNENYDFMRYNKSLFVVNNEIKKFCNLNVQFFQIDIKTVENRIATILKEKNFKY